MVPSAIAKGDETSSKPATPLQPSATPKAPELKQAETPPEEPEPMTIGSVAPSLDIEHWMGEEPSPMTGFEPGQVTVVEFWATWCGPCLYSMPHLAELQTRYRDEGLRVVSVSREDLETVTNFLDKEVPETILHPGEKEAETGESEEEPDEDQEPITYGELTSAYSLTTDPDASVHTEYMKAANQNGIPTAFIVGKDGHVEWIGHPMSMDSALEAVLNDQWDREAAKEEFEKETQMKLAYRELVLAQRAGKHELVAEMLEENTELFAASKYENAIESLAFANTLALGQAEKALATIEEKIAATPNDAVAISSWARSVAQAVRAGQMENEKVLQTTIDALESALAYQEENSPESLPNQWMAMNAMAYLQAAADDKEAAIEWQTRALEVAPEVRRRFLQPFLDELTSSDKEEESEETETAAETE